MSTVKRQLGKSYTI